MNWESLLAYDIDFNNHGHTGTTSLWQLCRNVFLQEFYHHDIANCLGWIRELFNLWEEGTSSLKRQKNSPEGVHKYKRARNKVVTLMRSAKKEHFHELNPHNVKQFWKSIKVLNKYNSSIPTQSQGSTILSTDVEKAAALNSFFSECFNRNVPPIIPLDLNQLSAHLSGWLAFLLLPSCWNQ